MLREASKMVQMFGNFVFRVVHDFLRCSLHDDKNLAGELDAL